MRFPNIIKLSRLLLALLLAGATTVALAQERPRRAQAPQTEQRQAAPQDGVLRLLPADAVTEHSADVGGNKLAYTATAGTLSLFDQSGERSAAIFYTAYVAKDAGTTSRPITFVFNGGPGAASAFLNLGAVGPRIVEFEPNGDGSAARLVDNPDTWLGFTDLVMIDPVGSGWSRAAKPDGGSAFWSVQGDADALAKTIALYLSKNGRSSSPKYILGESYGGFRAAKVARALQREQGIIISGIVMVSPMLEGSLLFGGTRFPLGAALHLPSLAATELERKGTFSKEALAAAEKFALTEYLTTLAGPPPKGEAARDFYKRVAEVSGLSESVIAKSRGFIRDAYLKNLRAAEGKIVSRYDATFAVTDPYPESESTRGLDPLLDGMVRVYGSAFAAYARDELGFKTEMTYTLLSSEVNRNWDWGSGTVRSTASVSDDLPLLLALSPSFRLLVTHGYSDMTTPYAVSRYVLDHLPNIGDPARAQLRLYRGGHMYYIDAQSRKAFAADAKAFYQEP
jgi:carboxypeptidase C (cathepsin A)